ncbi:methyltransferase domain-containing protein [Pelagibius litoralis]|uniref:Methyltransferase domain-containing protein n=1 Tax=Pelagibius litoralis TaxID=374515 RepID=A0A967C9G3_9PROT|nr:methyltransferase domain-containing protein [Pelagibius litoralis]NIA69082.1 methyltransferase domain-containing protein [Pelagibius litoralis]
MAQSANSGPLASTKARIPFWMRLKAWWEGYDLTLHEKKLIPFESGDLPAPEPGSPEWLSKRLEIMQEIWGDGMAGPGDAAYILKLVKPFALDPAHTVIEVGAGLGGATRVIAEHFDIWMTGLEADREVADAGMELSTMAGLAKRAPVHYFDVDHYEFRESSIDCVFSKEALFLVEDKKRLLAEIINMIKPRGQLLFTDYVLAEGANRKQLAEWAKGEPETPHLWTIKDYEAALTEARLDIRIKEDITDDVHKIITSSWANFLSSLRGRQMDKSTSDAVEEAVELWTRRTKAIDSGALRLCRFHALKKEGEKMLSDW